MMMMDTFLAPGDKGTHYLTLDLLFLYLPQNNPAKLQQLEKATMISSV
jgi:hypothetical protein